MRFSYDYLFYHSLNSVIIFTVMTILAKCSFFIMIRIIGLFIAKARRLMLQKKRKLMNKKKELEVHQLY